MIKGTVYGRKAEFCNEQCRDSFKCDRDHNLIYPSYDVEGEIIGAEEASIKCGFCAYCGSDTDESTTDES